MTQLRRNILLTFVATMVAVTFTACAPPAPDSGTDDGASDSSKGKSDEGSGDKFDPATCLVGEWTISEAQMQKYYDEVSAGIDGVSFTVNGTTDLTFDDTNYTYFPGFSLGMEIVGQQATGTLTGSIKGDYVVNKGEITTTNDNNLISMMVEVAGQTIDGTELTSEILSASPVNSAPYECRSGPELVIEMDSGHGRVPITLVPKS